MPTEERKYWTTAHCHASLLRLYITHIVRILHPIALYSTRSARFELGVAEGPANQYGAEDHGT